MRFDELLIGDYTDKPNIVYEETVDLRHFDSKDGELTLKGIFQSVQDVAMDHLKAGNAAVPTLIEENILLFVIRLRLEINRMPKTDETVKIKAWLYFSKRRGVLRYHTIETPDGELLAQIVSRWVCIDKRERKMYPVEVFNERWKYQYPEMSDCPNAGSFKYSVELSERHELTVDESMLDMYGHLNNCEYAGFVDKAMQKFTPEANAKIFEITFNSEARLGDTLQMKLGHGENELSMEAEHGRGVCFKAKVQF